MIGVHHGGTESRQQPLVFAELLEFATNIIGNHHFQSLGLSVMKQNSMETVGTEDVQVGLKDQIHVLVHPFHQGVDEHVRVNDDEG